MNFWIILGFMWLFMMGCVCLLMLGFTVSMINDLFFRKDNTD
jgi:hypothetical protein